MEKEKAITVENNKVTRLILSPSSIGRFDNCPAGYIYQSLKGILPNIDSSEMKSMALAGRALHSISEEDFDDEFIESILAGKSESKQKDIKEMSDTASSRKYVTDSSRTEVFLVAKLKEGLYLRGYADRLSPTQDGLKIIDLKSTGDPRPYEDRQQLMGYAYCISHMTKAIEEKKLDTPEKVSNELYVSQKDAKKLLDVTGGKALSPENMSLIIDYVRADMVSDFYVTESDIVSYGNYIISVANRIKRTINSFLSHRDVSKIEHHPGKCGFCPMKGICIAYQLTSNPHFNPVKPDNLSTSDILRELIDVDDISKRSTERAKVLKKALIVRSVEGDPEVSKHCSVVRGTTSTYPSKEVILRLVPKIMKKATKNIQFKDMVDWEEVNKAVVSTIIALSKANLGKNDIPSGYEKDVEDLKRLADKAPYIKIKS